MDKPDHQRQQPLRAKEVEEEELIQEVFLGGLLRRRQQQQSGGQSDDQNSNLQKNSALEPRDCDDSLKLKQLLVTTKPLSVLFRKAFKTIRPFDTTAETTFILEHFECGIRVNILVTVLQRGDEVTQ
jgi:hypothetical protein